MNSGYAQRNFALRKVKSFAMRNLLALKKILNFASYGFQMSRFNNLNFKKKYLYHLSMNLLLTPQQQNVYHIFCFYMNHLLISSVNMTYYKIFRSQKVTKKKSQLKAPNQSLS